MTKLTARSCSFEGCTRPHAGRGYCSTHYEQLRLRGALKPIRMLRYSPTTVEREALHAQGLKVCPNCGETKSLSQFYTRTRSEKFKRAAGFQTNCKACCTIFSKRRTLAKSWLTRSFGITAEDWNRMFAEQKGCCAICMRHQSETGPRQMQVDHDHATGKVRGLLCGTRNRALGLMRDDPFVMTRAVEYLRLHAGDRVEGKAPCRQVETVSEKVG